MARRLSELLSMLPFEFEPADDNPRISAPVTENAGEIEPGGLFLARQGRITDGHRFIAQAVERGAAAVVGERDHADVADALNGVAYARVPNGYESFGYLVSGYEGNPSRHLIVIAVTGTNGKTTTTTTIYHILKAAGVKVGLISTVAAHIGDREISTGLHVTNPPAHQLQRYLSEMVNAGMTHVVLEVTSQGLDQGRVNGTQIDVAVLTNITHEHLDWHGSFAAYRTAKARLFHLMKETPRKGSQPNIAVINADDPSAPVIAEASVGADYLLLYSTHQKDADLYADNIHYGASFTSFMLRGNAGDIPVRSPLVGQYNVSNVLAGIGGAIAAMPQPENQQLMINAIPRGVADMPQIPGRMERIDAGQNFIAIVDFAHTPDALEKAIAAGRLMTAGDGRVIVVFGSAGLRDVEKRRLMAEVAADYADLTVLTAEDPRTESLSQILDTMKQSAQGKGAVEGETLWAIPDRGRAILHACELAQPGDVVMVCGKGHEQSMCFGSVEHQWDDRNALRLALQGTPQLTLPSATEPYDTTEAWRND
jgi:UDP-N-acetylmuramoyl-L-alanyl-D-glutamate--2,6-diaminopimelate ligase